MVIASIPRIVVGLLISLSLAVTPCALAAKPKKAPALAATPLKKAPATAPKKSVKPAARKATPKPDPVVRLALALRANSIGEGDDLYAACQTSNFRELARSLSPLRGSLDAPKGEYETTAQYEQRRDKLASTIRNGRRAIVCMPVSDRDLAFNYDADRSSFFGSAALSLEPDLDFTETGKYVSTTRMGLKATVTSFLEISYRAEFARPETDTGCIGYGRIGLAVPVPIESAPTFKRKAYLAMMGQIQPPYIEYSETPGEPTIDHPKDIMTITLSIPMTLEEVAIVDPNGTHFHCRISG